MLQIILTLNITIVYSYLSQGCEDAERLSMMSGNNYEHVAKSRSHCVACGIGIYTDTSTRIWLLFPGVCIYNISPISSISVNPNNVRAFSQSKIICNVIEFP